MQRNVEALIGRLATDPMLLRRFAEGARAVLAEASAQGFELTDIEQEALAAMDVDALREFAGTLDRRLRRAVLDDSTR